MDADAVAARALPIHVGAYALSCTFARGPRCGTGWADEDDLEDQDTGALVPR